jgi:ABC-type branched-subunit amino acid transport system ATPase component/ABC-type branched-subunit amino acid transport system permease subunit
VTSATGGGRGAPRWLARAGPLLLLCAALAVAPIVLPGYLEDLLTRALAFGILAMSLDLLLGYTGLFSLGHAAFLGVGGYAAGMLMLRYQVGSLWAGVAAAIVVAAIVGAGFGVLALRVRGVYFLLVTFALGQLVVAAARHWAYLSPVGGGTVGIIGISLPSLGFSSTPSLTSSAFYFVAAAAAVISLMALRHLLATPLGYAAQGVRESEHRMRALGFNTWIVKYIVYVVGAAFAGLAGALLAYTDGIAVPDTFDVETSTLVLLMVLIGGAGTLYGPLIGAVILVFGEYYASTATTERWPLILGGLFVATVMFARRGVVVTLFDLVRGRLAPALGRRGGGAGPAPARSEGGSGDGRVPAAPGAAHAVTPPDADAEPGAADAVTRPDADAELASSPQAGGEAALAVEGLSKYFGGVGAVRDVSLTVAKGERLAVIGTNGAGKSTLFKLIAGDLAPTHGRVRLFGADITKAPVHRRAQLGIGRSFQLTSLLPQLTVWVNAWLAVQGVQPWRLQGARRASRHRDAEERVEALLAEWGLWELRDVVVAELGYGDQRRLEIVVALASRPRLLLMDEPTAGQTMEESLALVRHLRALPRDVTVVVIAHDMDLVFSVADRIVAMHEGRVIADGTGEDIQNDSAVQEIYMGVALAGEDAR